MTWFVSVEHDDLKYFCDQCPYMARDMSTLKTHRKVKHEGLRYPCDQCEYMATKKDSLKKHKERLHEENKLLCDQGLRQTILSTRNSSELGTLYFFSKKGIFYDGLLFCFPKLGKPQ